jgi:uncharacterized protein with GYD domain
MATFILLTRLTHGTAEMKDLTPEGVEQQIIERVRAVCPQVEWVSSYAVLGPYDYLDVFRAPDVETALQVSMIVRRFGHAQTEVWGATEWARFKELAHSV